MYHLLGQASSGQVCWSDQKQHYENKTVNKKPGSAPLSTRLSLWLALTISLGRNMSSCRRTTRDTLSPCRVLRSMHTSSSWPTPVISTPFTYKHTHSQDTATIIPILLIIVFCYSGSDCAAPRVCGLQTEGVHLSPQRRGAECFSLGSDRDRAPKNLWSLQ